MSTTWAATGDVCDVRASEPVYAGLSDAQVERYQQRLVADLAFAGRLTGRIQQTCGSAPS